MDTRTEFERYGNWVADKSPLYGRLAKAAADEPQLLDIASEAPEGQPKPELLLAAVHFLLLDGRDTPLKEFYPSCGSGESDGDPVPHFRSFCSANEEQLRELVSTRRCQTNEVGRSAVLYPAFERVTQTADADSLAQIELGSSAGLNLNWDRYRYRYEGVGTVGNSASPAEIATDLRGKRRPPLSESPPEVKYRRGIDLHPLDVTDSEDARWLCALIPPNQIRRHERLKDALEVARENQPTITEGDILETLPDLLPDVPDDTALVVFSTHVLYQLPAETVADLRELLADHSTQRPIHWLSLDPDEELGKPVYRHVSLAEGKIDETQIARFESYGEWIRWLAD